MIGRQFCFLPATVHITPEREGHERAEQAESKQENHVDNSSEQPVAGVVGNAELMFYAETPDSIEWHQEGKERKNAAKHPRHYSQHCYFTVLAVCLPREMKIRSVDLGARALDVAKRFSHTLSPRRAYGQMFSIQDAGALVALDLDKIRPCLRSSQPMLPKSYRVCCFAMIAGCRDILGEVPAEKDLVLTSADAFDLFDGSIHVGNLSIDLDVGAGGGGADFGQASGDGVGEGVEALRAGGGFALACDWFAGVAADADAGVDFDFAEDWDAVGDSGLCAFAVPENIYGLVAVGAGEGAHVFDYAEDFYVDLAEHFDGFANVG